MGSAGRPSPADLDVSERLATRGVDASASRLHHLRSEGWIPGPDRLPDGSYRYSAKAEDYAAELIGLLTGRRNLAMVTLTQFGRGRVPRLRALRNAYLAEIRKARQLLAKGKRRGADALDVAELVVSKEIDKFGHSASGRAMRDRLRRLKTENVVDESPDALLESALAQILVVVATGEPTSEDALQELLDTIGLGAAARDRWGELGPLAENPVEDVLPVLRGLQLDRFEARIRNASLKELIEARDTISGMLDLMTTAGQLMRFMTPLPDAFGFGALTPQMIEAEGAPFGRDLAVGRLAPLMLLIGDQIPEAHENAAALLSNLPLLSAQVSLRDGLPPELRKVNGMKALQRLPEDEQRRLIYQWARQHPEEARLAGVDLGDAGNKQADGKSPR